MTTLASIHVYPLKGCRAIDLGEAAVEPWGLAGDRRWLLVDSDCRYITQREHPSLARLVVRYGPGGPDRPGGPYALARPGTPGGPGHGITVTCAGCPPLWVPTPAADPEPTLDRVRADGRAPRSSEPEMLKVTVWRSTLLAAAAGPSADAWFSGYLGQPVRLVYLDDPTRRAVDPEFGRDGDVVSFADGYPLLLTSTGSLAQLGEWLTAAGDQPVPMNRFRPNVVVAGFEPWAEDRWRRIRIGAVSFRVAKPCARCVVTTTDQITGARGSQPLKMLARRRRFGQSLVFGQNIIPDFPGPIRVGDQVEITEYAQ